MLTRRVLLQRLRALLSCKLCLLSVTEVCRSRSGPTPDSLDGIGGETQPAGDENGEAVGGGRAGR